MDYWRRFVKRVIGTLCLPRSRLGRLNDRVKLFEVVDNFSVYGVVDCIA